MNLRDLTNKKFGRLTVLRKTDKKDKWDRCFLWECKCDCGSICYVDTHSLTKGIKKSCGCLLIESANASRSKRELIDGTAIDALKAKMYKNNTSGYKGVIWRKDLSKYQARIQFKGKMYSLGVYLNPKTASKVYQEAKKNLHGEFLEWYENFKKEEKGMINVSYMNGQSEEGNGICVYMLAETPNGRLYAEVSVDDYEDIDDPETDDQIYELLKSKILEQSKEIDFPESNLKFFRD